LPHYFLTIWRNFAPQRKTKKQKRNIILQPKALIRKKVEKVVKGFFEKKKPPANGVVVMS
jgi:hypothetical protein